MSKEFKFKLKVYYEDTDSGGVVYYANYLKFLERARTDALNTEGLSNLILLKKYQTLLIVRSCKIEYLMPAKLEDTLEIFSKITSKTRSSFVMEQIVKKNDQIITDAEVLIVTVNEKGKPIKIPDILNNFLN